ncbi:hypothetical protein RIF29_38840 [Crotalaria pallida]|uniref:Uncharacterized protein n=1 Tax=Crotalaria pallida TaxID=3830 RepID=A0AAN9HSS1_CROPI
MLMFWVLGKFSLQNTSLRACKELYINKKKEKKIFTQSQYTDPSEQHVSNDLNHFSLQIPSERQVPIELDFVMPKL